MEDLEEFKVLRDSVNGVVKYARIPIRRIPPLKVIKAQIYGGNNEKVGEAEIKLYPFLVNDLNDVISLFEKHLMCGLNAVGLILDIGDKGVINFKNKELQKLICHLNWGMENDFYFILDYGDDDIYYTEGISFDDIKIGPTYINAKS
ncbi:hypothetical protein ACT4RS_05360 [Ornithobacterium rhinotracheale]|uniref:hypothetical protein n=1 Tax=Ornithobacterium rhinotracheale TaxID=28251 RepID=UPI004036D217